MNRLLICKNRQRHLHGDERDSSRNLSDKRSNPCKRTGVGNDSTPVGILSKLKPIHRIVKMSSSLYLAVYVLLAHICRLSYGRSGFHLSGRLHRLFPRRPLVHHCLRLSHHLEAGLFVYVARIQQGEAELRSVRLIPSSQDRPPRIRMWYAHHAVPCCKHWDALSTAPTL